MKHDLPYPGLRWPEEYLSIVSGKEQQDGTYQLASKDMLYLLWLKQLIAKTENRA